MVSMKSNLDETISIIPVKLFSSGTNRNSNNSLSNSIILYPKKFSLKGLR